MGCVMVSCICSSFMGLGSLTLMVSVLVLKIGLGWSSVLCWLQGYDGLGAEQNPHMCIFGHFFV